MNDYELKGHSGCKLIVITQKDGSKIVKKQSKNESYNDRLKAQVKKQISYNGVFNNCKILKEGYNNSLYEFDMEYISGVTVAKYMTDIRLVDIYKFVELFFLNICRENTYDVGAREIFTKKIQNLKKTIKEKSLLYSECFELLETNEWRYMVLSECHGDMTLENMIIQDGEIYLIDFLDSFYNSWLIDVAKILQDADVLWSYRTYEKLNANLKIKLIILKQLIIEQLLTFRDGKYLVGEVYHILLLNLMRIIPYTKDEETKNYIDNKIAYIYKNILKIRERLTDENVNCTMCRQVTKISKNETEMVANSS
ncbi:hypothetical protein [Bacillus cereus]|uniref:hypothetical protein n=1 Tax=Bacillus cereus TaxID=1396 RepID=UPI0035C9C59E